MNDVAILIATCRTDSYRKTDEENELSTPQVKIEGSQLGRKS